MLITLKIDYMSFKSDAIQEIKEHANTRNINIMSAITELYQPPLEESIISSEIVK